ncbi:ATP-binding protein [Candidatus Uabimicrobium amorphum]|uniref:ATP-binding protein n=1 Tax=Uabimicrobium amorphum TaxID=2596890 RepID=UPI001563A1C4|nr:ATP-binding protein [Candidatus Uabimicrobium amorphum]
MKLQILSGPGKGRIFHIQKERVTIGRKADQDIRLVDDVKISRCHCEIVHDGADYILHDLNSVNGTWVNDERVTYAQLESGETFTAGQTEFLILNEQESAVTLSSSPTAHLNFSTISTARLSIENSDITVLKKHIAVFQKVSESLVGKLQMENFLEAIVEIIIKAIHAERAFVLLVDQNMQFSEPVVVKNYATSATVSETILRKCIEDRLAILIEDTQSDSDYKNSESIRRSSTRAAMCVPLISKDKVAAVIYLDSRHEQIFHQNDLKLLASIAKQAELAIENIKLYEELQKKHQELKSAQEQLVKNEKLSIVGTLATAISHDMKNILTPILGVSYIVLKNDQVDPSLREAFERQIERLQSLTQQLLSLVRTDPIKLAMGNINDKVEQSLQLIKTEARCQKVTIKRNFTADLPSVYMDVNRLDQVFINLCLNAIQAMAEQEKSVLEVGSHQDDTHVILYFKDNGPGIRPEYQNLIFEPFFTTKSTGTGMGLFSCKKIIEKDHKGILEIESHVGEGTTFTIKLPKK